MLPILLMLLPFPACGAPCARYAHASAPAAQGMAEGDVGMENGKDVDTLKSAGKAEAKAEAEKKPDEEEK